MLGNSQKIYIKLIIMSSLEFKLGMFELDMNVIKAKETVMGQSAD